jgi:hypothetical protein
VSGHVQAACWSPCGSVLLFATSEEPIVYSLTFSKLDTVFQHDDASKTALPVVDLTELEVNEGERLVTLRLHDKSPCSGLHGCVKWIGSTEFLLLKTYCNFTTATGYVGSSGNISALY